MTLFRDQRGATAIVFAIMLLGVLAVVGGAIDMSRHRSAENRAQIALDAALLNVAHDQQDKGYWAVRRDIIQQFKKQLDGDRMKVERAWVWRDNDTLNATVTGYVETTLLGVVGVRRLQIKRESQIRFSDKDAEVALILDMTGSMRGETIDRLKSATKHLLDRMDAMNNLSSTGDRFKIGLVPFSTYVNVGPQNKSKSWMDRGGRSDVSADNLEPKLDRVKLYEHLGLDWSGCVQARAYPHDVRDTKPVYSKPETLFAPLFHPDEPDVQASYASTYLDDQPASGSLLQDIQSVLKYGINPGSGANAASWASVSRQAAYTFYSDQIDAPGPDLFCPFQPIMALTTDMAKLKTAVEAIEPQGSTNIIEGLSWGWRVLSPQEPFTEGGDYDTDERLKFAVLVSDGNNFMHSRADERGSEFGAYGYAANGRLGLPVGASLSDFEAEMDKRTLDVCEGMKKEGIIVYTLRLELTDTRSESLMKRCATDASTYLNVPTAQQLDATFDQLSQQISMLYLSR